MSIFGFAMDAPEPRRRPWWHGVIVLAVVLTVIGFGLQRLLGGPADFPADTAGEVAVVSIEAGDTLRVIGTTLVDADVVASIEAFIGASEANSRSRYITPGDYRLPTHIPAATAITLLLSPESRDELRITIKEGWRAERAYAEISDRLGIDVDEVRAAFEAADLPPSANGRIEGYIFPATYAVKRSATAAEVATATIDRFYQAASQLEIERRARVLGYTARDIVIIASLIEGEAAPADYAKVARVIYNRLRIDMPLQLDSTVNYGLGTSELQLSSAQLKQDTPYNTYLRKGLPPTAIGSPGEASIEAALSPADGSWLYFVTTDPKTRVTKFATSYEEFLVLKAELKRNVG